MNKSNFKNFSLSLPVVLIGMMGAGKTSVGRALAGLMNAPFIDSDSEIEDAAGQSVADIFSALGEAEFRKKERQIIARLLDGKPCVLSLGGGAFMDETTRARIKDKAFSVWLKVDKGLLFKRVMHAGHRPLLKGENPQEKLESLLAARESIYAQADLTAYCDDRPVLENARQLMIAIQAALNSQTA